MRYLIIALLIGGVALNSNAQKVKIRKKKVEIEFIGLSKTAELSEYDSYTVDFDAKQKLLNILNLTPSKIEEFFKLFGYSYTEEGGDFTYRIQMKEPRMITEKSVKILGEKRTRYQPLVRLSIPTVIEIVDNETEEPIHYATFSTADNPTEYKGTAASKKGAEKTLNNKKSGLNKHALKLYRERLKKEIDTLKHKYSYSKLSYPYKFMDIKVKKAPGLSGLHDEIEKVTHELSEMSYRKSHDPIRDKLNPILEKWSKEAAELDNSDRNDSKLKFVYLYNLGSTHFWLEQFDKAREANERLIENGFRKRKSHQIRQNINGVEKVIEETGHDTRHFYRKGFYADYNYTYEEKEIEKKEKSTEQKILKHLLGD